MADEADPAAGWSCYTSTPADSLALFETLRGRCPLGHSDEHDGFHLLVDFAAVRDVMLNHDLFSSTPQVLRPMLPRKPIPALEMDPPRHAAWRAIFNEAVNPRAVARMEGFVRTDVRAHIDRFIELGACDIVRDLAEPVPAETICALVGVDEANVPAIREAAIAMFAAQGDPEEFGRRQAQFAALTVSEVRLREAAPRDDFLTSLATREVEGRRLDDDDYVVLLAAFLGAGHHSTTSAIASLVHEVFTRPALRDRLIREPAKIGAAVEETLRLHPSFYGFFRRTTSATEIGGTALPEGTDVYVGWAAANRDPARFARPDAFDIDRPFTQHLTFGRGIHTCPGASLARLELRIVLEELLAAVPDLAIDGPAPEYRFGGGDYAFLPSLRVRFTPRARHS